MNKTARPVLDGQKVRWTLETVEQQNPDRVRVDWLRFSLPVDSVVPIEGDAWDRFDFTKLAHLWRGSRDEWERLYFGLCPCELAREITLTDGSLVYMTPQTLAMQGAYALQEMLPGLFTVGVVEASGMDFYAARAHLMVEGVTVGFVCAGGRSHHQSSTVHFNFSGSFCLHLKPRELRILRDFIEVKQGWITRCDLSLDVWQGLPVERVRTAWMNGEFDVRGKRPNQCEHGSWTSGHSRTFEVGSRNTGKLLRAYEKGHQLFGPEAADPWVRVEVEFRNNQRVLDPEMLARPADYFAGAYPWCSLLLQELELDVEAAKLHTHNELKDKTAEAAVSRIVKWVNNTAAPALCALWDQGGDLIAEVIVANRFRPPRRLLGFSRQDIARAFEQVAASMAPAHAHSSVGAA